MEVFGGQGKLNSMELAKADMVDVDQMVGMYCEWYMKKWKEDTHLKVSLW
jgi:hypothetical protein